MSTWSYETTPVLRGLDWIIQKGIEAMEREHQSQMEALRETIEQMGKAATTSGDRRALAIYREYRGDV